MQKQELTSQTGKDDQTRAAAYFYEHQTSLQNSDGVGPAMPLFRVLIVWHRADGICGSAANKNSAS